MNLPPKANVAVMHLFPLLYNGILSVQKMLMSYQCSFPECALLRKIELITFPHINHSAAHQNFSLGGNVLQQ